MAKKSNLLNPTGVKEFVIDGAQVYSLGDFWDEIQNVLCPGFNGFGRNWAAFRDILRGGFLAYEFNENIRIRLIHSSNMRKRLSDGDFKRILKTFSRAENVDFHVY